MKTLTIEYDPQNKDNDDEFSRDLEQAISGDELMSRLSVRINKMFENENLVSPKS
jgi:hypothetical protein